LTLATMLRRDHLIVQHDVLIHGLNMRFFSTMVYGLGCLGGAVVERRTRDRKVAGSTPGPGAIKSTRLTQPFHPSWVGKSSTGLYGWG